MQSRVSLFVVCTTIGVGVRAAGPSDDRWMVQLEVDPSQTTSNTLQRPNNSTTTRFDSVDFTGEDITLGRFSLAHRFDRGRADAELRLDIAPFQQSGTRVPTSTIRYNGTTFEAGVPLSALYQFNTYRLTYDVPLFAGVASDTWRFRLGGTLADGTRSIAANSRRTVTVLMRTLRQGYRGERPHAAVLQSGMTCY